MSFKAMEWAVKQKCGSSSQKLVLLMLADHCNKDTGQCNPSHKKLAEECEMSVSSLKAQIKALAEKGKLTILPRFSEGVKLPNQYELHFEGGQADFDLPSQILTDGQADSGGGVRQILTDGQADSGYKPVTKPVTINQEDNHKESARKNPKISLPDYIDKATWDEWMTVRKKKGAVISETSTTRLLNTLAKVEADEFLRSHGYTPNEAIAIAIENSWKGLNIEWLRNRLKQQGGSTSSKKAGVSDKPRNYVYTPTNQTSSYSDGSIIDSTATAFYEPNLITG